MGSNLLGKHVLITGGGSGIGAAIARALYAEGALLSLAGRRSAPIMEICAALPGTAGILADITRQPECTRMVLEANAVHGPVDIVIANAGAAESTAFARAGLDHWNRMLQINLTGAFLTVSAALGDVLRKPVAPDACRRIIFIASTAGLKGYPYAAAYGAAKHGVVGLMRGLAAEYAHDKLTVNAICPGFTETPLLDASVAEVSARTGRTAGETRAALARSNPQGRLVTPAEVAATVRWLCGPLSGSITGQAISVSGGEI